MWHVAGRRETAGAAALGVLATLVGVSRVYLGVHWTTDVIGGWLVGGAWLAAATSLWIAARAWAASGRDGQPDALSTRGAAAG